MRTPSVQSGRLRHKGVIEQQSETRDAMGGVTISWTTAVNDWWAEVAPARGREFMDGQQITQDVTHMIYGRKVPNMTITPSMRFTWNNRVFNFVEVRNIKERDILLEILAKEDLNA